GTPLSDVIILDKWLQLRTILREKKHHMLAFPQLQLQRCSGTKNALGINHFDALCHTSPSGHHLDAAWRWTFFSNSSSCCRCHIGSFGVSERLLHRLRIMGDDLKQRARRAIWREPALLPIAHD